MGLDAVLNKIRAVQSAAKSGDRKAAVEAMNKPTASYSSKKKSSSSKKSSSGSSSKKSNSKSKSTSKSTSTTSSKTKSTSASSKALEITKTRIDALKSASEAAQKGDTSEFKKQLDIATHPTKTSSKKESSSDEFVGPIRPETPDILTKKDVIVSHAQDTVTSMKDQLSSIDDTALYELESGEIVSGKELKGKIVQSNVKNIASSITRIPSGKYVEKDGEYFMVDDSTSYLLTHASPGESQKLYESIGEPVKEVPDDFVGPIQPSAAALASESAYESLSKDERVEYGKNYVDWSSIPIEEIKYYEGGKEYLESISEVDRQRMIDTFLKEHPDLQKESTAVRQRDLSHALFPQSIEDITDGAGTNYKPYSKRNQRDTAWDLITTPEHELQKQYYGDLDQYAKMTYSYSKMVTDVLASPVTLPQAVVKLTSGKQVGPDIASMMAETHPGTHGAPGLVSGTISEGIGAVTGEGSDAFEKMAKDPLSAMAGTFGEIVGSAALGAAGKGVKNVASDKIVKPTIRSMPKVASGFKNTFGMDIPGYNLVSQSRIGKTAYDWSTGFQKGSQYALKSTKYLDDAATGVSTKVDDVYKNVWGKSEKYVRTRQKTWMSPDEVARFQKSLKPDTSLVSRAVKTSQSTRIKIQAFTDDVTLKGFRNRKLFKTSGSMEMEKIIQNPFKVTTKVGRGTKGSLYNVKPSSFVDDFVQPKPSVLKSMLQKGYTTKRPTGFTIKDKAMAQFYGASDDIVKGPLSYADDVVKGFGKTDFLQSPRFYGGHFKPIKTKFFRSLSKSKEAMQSVIPRIKRNVINPTSWKSAGKEIWKKTRSMPKGSDFMIVPLAGSGMLPMSAAALGSGTALGFRSELMSEQAMKMDFKQFQQPVQINMQQPKMEYRMEQQSAMDSGFVPIMDIGQQQIEVPVQEEETIMQSWIPPVKAMGKPKPFYFDVPPRGSKKKKAFKGTSVPTDMGQLKREFDLKNIWRM